MKSSFLLRTVFLIIALIVVVLVMIATVRINFNGSSENTADTQTFFEQFVIAGGPIVWFVLLPMSLITVYLAVEQGLIIRRKHLLPEGAGDKIVETIRRLGPEEAGVKFSQRSDLVTRAVVKAITKGRGDWFRMRSVLTESLGDQASGLLRKIEWLNMIGNVSPMVGLFGTVFGMIKLFNAIVITGGQPQPARLAEGISIALVTTFWGLFIAIPALSIYGVFRNRIETLVSDAVVEAENIMPQIRGYLKKQQQQEVFDSIKKVSQPIHQIANKKSRTVTEPLHP